jgi:hypothetical protein
MDEDSGSPANGLVDILLHHQGFQGRAAGTQPVGHDGFGDKGAHRVRPLAEDASLQLVGALQAAGLGHVSESASIAIGRLDMGSVLKYE